MCACTMAPSSLQALTASNTSPSAAQFTFSGVWTLTLPLNISQQTLRGPARSQGARLGRYTRMTQSPRTSEQSSCIDTLYLPGSRRRACRSGSGKCPSVWKPGRKRHITNHTACTDCPWRR